LNLDRTRRNDSCLFDGAPATSKHCGVAVNLVIISERSLEARPALSLDAETRHLGRSWLGAALEGLDSRLRLRQGVIGYTDRPDCLFRIQVVESCNHIQLSDGTPCASRRSADKAAFVERTISSLSCRVPTLAWARRLNRAFDTSLRELAHFLEVRQDLDEITAICGNMAFAPAVRSARLVRRFGFEKIEMPQSFRQRQHWFGENILISMIVLTHNAMALRADTLRRGRALVFLSRRTLLRRYGSFDDQAALQLRLLTKKEDE